MSVGLVFNAATSLAPAEFEALIGQVGQRCSWMKSHTCPCIFAPASQQNRLPTPGSAQRNCKRCGGVGIYWDAPSIPFRAGLSFMHLSPSPDEPGTLQDEKFGTAQTSEPSLTLPYRNPYLAMDDPAQPTAAWSNASTDDIFVAVDMLSRYTAMLQSGVQENLPFQQNLQVAPSGAVTTWDPETQQVEPVANYGVNGPTVTISGYPSGTFYMVEFQSAALFVAFRRAGGLPHVRPLDGGATYEPRRFRVQALDFWTRQRGIQPSAAGTTFAGGTALPMGIAVGAAAAR